MESVLSKSDIYEVGVSLMQFLGEDIHSTSRKIVFYRIANCIVMVFVLIFTTANFLRVQGEMYIDTLESWISLNHIFLKYILFIYYKTDIGSIMDIRLKKYWNYTLFNQDIIDTVNRAFSFVKSIENFLLVLTVFLMYMIFLQPILFKNTVFLVKTWVFVDSYALNAVVLACQYYIYIIVIPIVVGYDIWYLTLCVDLALQVRLIKHNLQHLSDGSVENGVKQIGDIIQHHLVLLSVFANMRRIYSSTMLFHYFVTLITACSDMYQLLIGDTSFINCLLKIPTLLFIFGEFAYYAVLAEHVSFEFSDLSNAIYMSRWYEKNIEIQKLLLFIMAKSQRVEYFTGAGLMDINIDAFGSLVRKTFSFYAIIKNLLNK